MIAQTSLPLMWVIVSDGSTDGTDEIVNRYAAIFPWIELLRMPERSDRHFAGKVHAFNAGYERVKDIDFDIVGNLDADVSFEPDQFEFLIGEMQDAPQIGVAGAPFRGGRSSTTIASRTSRMSGEAANCFGANVSTPLGDMFQ